MPYRSLLVLLDQSNHHARRTEVAIRLAKHLDCHLVGLAATGLVDLPSSPSAAGALAAYAAQAWDALREEAVRSTQAFRDACRGADLKACETVVDEADKAASLLHHAHCSDLVLLTQPDPDAPDRAMAQEMVDQVVLRSARPVLLLPYVDAIVQVDRLGAGSHVMVAWDDSPEAARAVSDALPLLTKARKVTVVSWRERGQSVDDATLRRRLDALGRWLLWHGVSAEVKVEATSAAIADAILSRAADLEADLLVMGAYGHSRWSEVLLGGATRGLLSSMTLPVLMSH